MNREQAYERLRNMSTNECFDYWNKSAVDHYCRLYEIHKMSDTEWWNHLSNELGAWNLLQAVLSSGERFNDSDMFFFYDEDNEQVMSFSTKQEFLEIVGDDFFIENMTNE